VPNLNQADVDQDGAGDACDDCPFTYDPDQGATAGPGSACNCAFPGVRLGPNGCACADGGEGSSPDACGAVEGPDGGITPGP
jgi:hypothetical protein